jgi:MIP family channel proteins
VYLGLSIKHNKSQYIAEFIGTFFLVFFGCGAAILAGLKPETMSHSGVSVVFGGVVSVMIYATGHISGAHFNPAVTLSFWITKKFPSSRVIGYLLSQISGALLASFIHMIIWGTNHSFGETSFDSSIAIGFMVEFILSFVLMFVIHAVATDSRAVGELAGIAIGSTVAICAFVGGPLTGASMNPARSIAPAIFSGELSLLWVYIVSPILGAMAGAVVYEWIKCTKESEDNSHGCC